MRHIDTVIIGGGQAGLALSHCLTDRGLEHVILERGRIGERWRSERWDSLRLLTPNWQSRLPGFSYDGDDPHGYMDRREVITYLERYAASFPAPVEAGVTVTRVERRPGGYSVDTDQGSWHSANVVIATGDCGEAFVPTMASGVSAEIHQVVPTRYKNPDQLPDGGVVVVGASATGVQLAAEIHASGRPVTLSVGRHTRLPRVYRGRDILWWLDRMGIFDERATDVRDLETSRKQPSLQLVGSPDRRTLDLSALMDQGVRLVGRAMAAASGTMNFDDNLIEDTVAAHVKLVRMTSRIDRYARSEGLEHEIPEAVPIPWIEAPDTTESLDLHREGIRTILWATGFKRSYPWLHVPVFRSDGEISHRGGVTPAAGLYVMGLRFLRRRNSTFIDGQAKDAAEIADHMLTVRERVPTAVA
jgi:putative flavoprotein involved in K+ transport